MLISSVKSEYLFSHSYRFIQQNNGSEYKFYEAPYLSHTFALSPQYEEAQDTINRILKFISQKSV